MSDSGFSLEEVTAPTEIGIQSKSIITGAGGRPPIPPQSMESEIQGLPALLSDECQSQLPSLTYRRRRSRRPLRRPALAHPPDLDSTTILSQKFLHHTGAAPLFSRKSASVLQVRISIPHPGCHASFGTIIYSLDYGAKSSLEREQISARSVAHRTVEGLLLSCFETPSSPSILRFVQRPIPSLYEEPRRPVLLPTHGQSSFIGMPSTDMLTHSIH